MRKCSTRTELLIISCIITALVVVLAPVFATAQNTTGAQKCQAHGRELGVAMLAYMADHDGKFPCQATPEMFAKFSSVTWSYDWPGYYGAPGYIPPRVWGVGSMNEFQYIQLAKYVKNKDTWICPAPTAMYCKKFACGYRNSWMFRSGGSQYDAGFQRSAKMPDGNYRNIGRTISQVLAIDAGGKNEEGKIEVHYPRNMTPSTKIIGFCYSVGDAYVVSPYPGGSSLTPAYAHGEGTIYLYLDGHAKYQEMGRGFNPVHYTSSPDDEPHQKLTSAVKS